MSLDVLGVFDLFPKCLLFDDDEFADVNEVDFTGMVNDDEFVLLVVVLLIFVRLLFVLELDDVSAHSSSDF